MDKGIDIIQRMTGRKPVGYRSPAAEFSPHTLRMLAEYGFGYSSNYFDDDSPYLHTIDGRLTDIVEFPFAWVLDDAPFFQYSITLPGRTMQAPSAVFEAWRREFDVLYREDRYFCLAMHPADHRAPVAHHPARGADPVHPRPSAGLAGPLRRGGRRAAAGAARGGARARPMRLARRRCSSTGAARRSDSPSRASFQIEAPRGHARSRRGAHMRGAGRRRGASGVDVAEERHARRGARAAAALGRLDGVVNSAGIDLIGRSRK